MTADDFKTELVKYAVPASREILTRFFKAGPGEYGEGDEFIGVKVPNTRKVCKIFGNMPLIEIQKLLNSPVHEHRLGGAIILANQYPRVAKKEKKEIFDMYIKNVAENNINNWDIVDVTCEYIVGAHLTNTDKKLLFNLAASSNLWARRVSIISTFAYIKRGEPDATLRVAKILLFDKHDLIQKAVGWMLREAGKRCDEKILINFLDSHAHEMPRTMLRYSIERLPDEKRMYYLKFKNDSS
ncbi:MAG: DNA alkylation repair protein, partial [Candidatus Saccharimonadales bacterium]